MTYTLGEPGDRAAAVAAVAAVAETMNTAGKAVAFSAVTVPLSLSAVLLVPSPGFRSMALGIMLSVLSVLAATLTLLPAARPARHQGQRRQNPSSPTGRPATTALATPCPPGGLDRHLAGWARTLWAHPWRAGAAALVVAGALIVPLAGLRTAMPSISIIPSTTSASIGYGQVGRAFGIGATGTLQVVVPGGDQSQAVSTLRRTTGVAGVLPGPTNGGYTLFQVTPTTGPSASATSATVERMRASLPAGSLVGGAAAENFDLQHALTAKTPIVFGLLLRLGGHRICPPRLARQTPP